MPMHNWNPVTIFWRIKQNGPYTKFGLNHMNPIAKIIAFQMKEMLYLQTLALMGQVSKVKTFQGGGRVGRGGGVGGRHISRVVFKCMQKCLE